MRSFKMGYDNWNQSSSLQKLRTLPIILFLLLQLSAYSQEDYPWLDGVLSENCCNNQTATAYDFGTYSYVYVERNGNCAPGGKLYFNDGTCWCEDKGDSICLNNYNLTSRTGEVLFECGDQILFTPFDQFDWLSSVASEEDCDQNTSIDVYLRDRHFYVFIQANDGLGRMYSATGQLLCTRMNATCVSLYGLSNITLSWNCSGSGTEDADITLRNTLEEDGSEGTYASLFGAADDAFDEFATFSSTDSEFATALAQPSSATGLPFDINGLYEIDFTGTSIDFTLLPDSSDPFWIGQFGVFGAGKVDRYYFTFSEPHNISSGVSTNPSVNLRVDSDKVVVVELSEGYDFNPGIAFSISLNNNTNITLRNTLEEDGSESTYASLFGAADDAFDEFATFSSTDSEFATALAQPSSATGLPFDINGLYEIDFTGTSIDFTLLPDSSDPFWIGQFGVFGAGKVDRYYFTFSEAHNISSGISTNPSVNLRVDSDKVVVVELSEGYDFNPGIAFSISLNNNTNITLRNTLEEDGSESTYASLFGAADDAFDEFATFSSTDSEFATALAQPSSATGLPFDINGLYEIDITGTAINFTLLPDQTDPFWVGQFGVFPAGKVDRYYFTFSEPHNITSGASNNSSVNLRVDSDRVIVVEISEGYDFNPEITFSIDFN